MIKIILIDGPSQKLYELEIAPSHFAVEEEIGTRFWIMRRLTGSDAGSVIFHSEGRNKGYEDFTFCGVGYSGCGLVCSIDQYGDLGNSGFSIREVARHTLFHEPAPRGPWPFPRGEHGTKE